MLADKMIADAALLRHPCLISLGPERQTGDLPRHPRTLTFMGPALIVLIGGGADGIVANDFRTFVRHALTDSVDIHSPSRA